MKSNSFLLLGPRGVGKTWLLRKEFESISAVIYLNLLDDKTYLDLLRDNNRLRNYLTSNGSQWIIIDEIQRIPNLLNIVHDILEDPKYHNRIYFALTGSSARKLKRGGANLLAGRALLYNLYPLSVIETGTDWKLEDFLNFGSLPMVVTANSDELRIEILHAYVSTYLKEEIKEEQIVRRIDPFSRFLESAAQANGTIIQYSNIARAANVDEKAVARYFEILEDTLIGLMLDPYSNSARERTSSKAKFYFFDSGVNRTVDRTIYTPLTPGTYAWGKAFEQFFILECVKLNSYQRINARLSFLRTKDNAEIDLIIEKPGAMPICIEIKSGKTVDTKEVNNLKRISSAVPKGIPFVVYNGETELTIEGVRIVPWLKALKEIFGL